MTSPVTQSLERIPDQLGYLVIHEDGAVIASSGELENDEKTAGIIMNMVHMASRVQLSPDRNDPFKRLSVVFDTYMFVITISNHKVYVCKRKYLPSEPINA
ncbi:ragulator complex protein LAMTOR4-like [Saccoglossus kowalevskii]|uniref:Late endosomal/lysosomal adaptor and MAPK and MTOR activator 4 n=1 Tax=Saccoglossus kowalevskii TaxID=10224 RepID=A0ABM0GS55_SACKO|nr:PREDICTED: ragulator complex protein LAMTOR4-like [Saccoglossus kowalevskii]